MCYHSGVIHNGFYMFIPETKKAFSKKTDLVVADHVHAKIYSIVDREVAFVEEIKTDYPGTDGDRTSTVNSGGRHFAEHPEHDQEIGEDHLFRKLAAYLHHRYEQKAFEELVIAAGPEMYKLESLLHPDVAHCVVKWIPKLLTHGPLEDVFDHLS